MEFIEVEIRNWEKYNPKRDQNTYSWLRLNNDFFYSSDLFDLNCEQKMVWISLLCLASKDNRGRINVNLSFIAHHLRLKIDAIREAIEIICARQLATAVGRTLPQTTPTNERTNVTKRTNGNAHAEAFALFWVSYPRKVGKGKAGKSYQKLVEAGTSPDEISKALANYLAYLRKEKIDAKYIKHGPTFLNEVRDWLDPAAGKSDSFANASDPDFDAREKAIFEKAGSE